MINFQISMTLFCVKAVTVVLLLMWGWAHADVVTRDDIDTWLGEEVLSDPPVEGTLVGADDLNLLSPYIAPGYIEEFSYPGSVIEIQSSTAYRDHPVFRRATERFKGQSRLDADGRLENYTAGRPFSEEQIAEASTDRAGFMVAWNHIYRWQYTGYQVDELSMTYLSGARSEDTPNVKVAGIEGTGGIGRRLTETFHRVYLKHLAWLPDSDYRMNVPDSSERLYKDYHEFLSPFDVAGTKLVIERPSDLYEDDQINTYLPTERRIRRISAKERSDAFMGSDVTLDDFEGFAGRVMHYKWKYLGRKKILDVLDPKESLIRFGGPLSRAVIDRWQVRDCHVVEVRSEWEGHPYSSKLIFIDSQTYATAYALAFDRERRFWKIFHPVYQAPIGDEALELETSVLSWRAQGNIDFIGVTATLVHALADSLHPSMKPSKIKRIFSVSSLTSGQ